MCVDNRDGGRGGGGGGSNRGNYGNFGDESAGGGRDWNRGGGGGPRGGFAGGRARTDNRDRRYTEELPAAAPGNNLA